MNTLIIKTFAGFANLLVILGLSLFLPAWSLNFWEAWVFLAVFFVPVLVVTVYFLRHDPELIERRLKAGPSAEKRISQKVIQSLASLFFILIFIVSGFDHRLHWSHVSIILVMTADVVVLLGFLIDDLYEVTAQDKDDDLIFELFDLIEHEPKRGGFLGLTEEKWQKYQTQISNVLQKLERDTGAA